MKTPYQIPYFRQIILCFLALLLNGCGGGGSSGTGGSAGGGGSTGGSGGSTGTQTVTIGGSVSGLTSGQSVTLEINGGSAQVVQGLASGASVSFSFPSVSLGSTYTVTVSNDPAGFLCPVSNGAGTASANVNDVAVSCHPPTLTTLYTFSGANATAIGTLPAASLIIDSQGNLFGTTSAGGADNKGTVFELKSTGSGTWATTPTTLYSFTGGTDGTNPTASLIMDSQGNLFGTANSGGANNLGTVFELKSTGAGTWASTLTTLYAFTGTGTDGASPHASLLMDNQGDLLSTTSFGGTNNEGTIFELKSTGSDTWAAAPITLYSFTDGTDGANPDGPLLMDRQGDLFGTTNAGGSGVRNGTLFELKSTGTAAWSTILTVLYDFSGIGTDGAYPVGTLIMDAQGNLFGMTRAGGSSGKGTLFELQSTGSSTWATTPTTLYSFSGIGTDGASPAASLLMDGAGNLFGTTQYGGSSANGTVFELASTGSGTWSTTPTTLYSFLGGSSGAVPEASLIMDSQGDLFGTANTSSYNSLLVTFYYGTVFELH